MSDAAEILLKEKFTVLNTDTEKKGEFDELSIYIKTSEKEQQI